MTLPPNLRNGYLEMIQDINPNVAITLNTYPGCQFSNESMLSRLKHFDACVARGALGRRWASKPDSERIQGVFVLEKGTNGINPHWHGFLHVPDDQIIRYTFLMKSAWERTHMRAWVEIDPQALENYTIRGSYVLKEVQIDSTEQIVFTNMLRG